MSRALSNPMTYCALVTLIPVPFLMAAAIFGGGWALICLLYLTLFAFAMDEWTSIRLPAAKAAHAPSAARLTEVLAGAQFLLLPFVLAGLSGATGLGWGNAFWLLLACALYFGQVSMANAHVLIHQTDKRAFRLGVGAHITMLFGHHVSAHRLVHHRFAATGEDPATADLDEGFYSYAERAWLGGFRAGHEMEQALAERVPGKKRRNPYRLYVSGAVLGLALTLLIFGFAGLVGYLLLAVQVQGQVLLTEYVQHYGLLRRRLPGGSVEPMAAEHSWNAGHWFTGLMSLNAGRTSDHHLNPKKDFFDLRLPVANSAPMLPYSLPVMCLFALYPPYWRQIMTQRAKAWRNAPVPAATMALVG